MGDPVELSRLNSREPVSLRGRLTLSSIGPDGQITDQAQGYNVVCTTGYTALAAALVWSGIQDQATNLGITTSTYLTPLFGAVGNGAGVPAKSDTALSAELGRVTVSGGGSTPASPTVAAMASWLFYFPNPLVNWTVTEAGVFANASAASGSGSMLDHWAFSPSVSVPTTNTMILEVSFLLGP